MKKTRVRTFLSGLSCQLSSAEEPVDITLLEKDKNEEEAEKDVKRKGRSYLRGRRSERKRYDGPIGAPPKPTKHREMKQR